MLMRKHLTGGKLLDVQMEPGDRIVYFTFQCTNEMGDLVQNILCAELMGRYSNLVLVQNGKIIDALKRVDFEMCIRDRHGVGLPQTGTDEHALVAVAEQVVDGDGLADGGVGPDMDALELKVAVLEIVQHLSLIHI